MTPLAPIIALCLLTISVYGEPNASSSKDENKATDHARHPTSFCNNQEPATKNKTAEGSTPHWYASSEWWLVIVAAITAGFIAWQARETARATQAMSRSTDVLMNIEQGRIVTYWERFIHLDSSRKGQHDGLLSHQFNWACGNIGKTPVSLIETFARFIAVKRLSDLPIKPNYSARHNRVPYQGEPLLPSTSNKPQTEWFSIPLETGLTYEEMEAKHRKRECFLYAYGYVRYADVWGRLHETRFGLVYDSQPVMTIDQDSWVVAGPSEYNKNT